MRLGLAAILATAVAFVAGASLSAQGDPDRVIPGGGIFVQGWTGKIDASSVRQGRMINDAKLAQEGNALHVTTGPATTYWNPANTASGDYTVKATFLEPKFMALNSHPHSYGIFIGGNGLGTDQMSLVYCVAYGDGNVLIRGFAPAVFTLLNTSPNAAVHKAAGVGAARHAGDLPGASRAAAPSVPSTAPWSPATTRPNWSARASCSRPTASTGFASPTTSRR